MYQMGPYTNKWPHPCPASADEGGVADRRGLVRVCSIDQDIVEAIGDIFDMAHVAAEWCVNASPFVPADDLLRRSEETFPVVGNMGAIRTTLAKPE